MLNIDVELALQVLERTKGLEEPSVHDQMPFRQIRKWLAEPDANDSKSMSEYNKVESEESEEDEITTASGSKATVKVKKASRVLTSELATLAPL